MSMTPARPRVLVALFGLLTLTLCLAARPARAQHTVTPAPGQPEDEPMPPALQPGPARARGPADDASVSAVGVGPDEPAPRSAGNSDNRMSQSAYQEAQSRSLPSTMR